MQKPRVVRTGIEVFSLALVAIGCDVSVSSSGSSSTASAATSTAPAGAAGDGVGATECDDVLKRAATPECKDKPGVATISGNRDNWKRGLSEANTKDATIQGCKAAMQTLDAVCVAGMAPPGTGSGR